jgi:hypothetical protein
MKNIKEQIIDWFNGPQDFETGVSLLEQVSKKDKVLGKLVRRGENKASFDKLVWELNKVARLKTIPEKDLTKLKKAPKFQKVKESVSEESEDKTRISLIKGKELGSYPPEVQKLVNEYSSLYMERGKKHSALKKTGDGNNKEAVDSRKLILVEIAKLSERMEILFEAFNNYEKNGIKIISSVLWPEPDSQAAAAGINPELSIDELKTLKKNIQSSITKDKNMLLFSTKTKPPSGKEKPLPAGPKRISLEKRVAKKEKEIYDLDMRIAELG